MSYFSFKNLIRLVIIYLFYLNKEVVEKGSKRKEYSQPFIFYMCDIRFCSFERIKNLNMCLCTLCKDIIFFRIMSKQISLKEHAKCQRLLSISKYHGIHYLTLFNNLYFLFVEKSPYNNRKCQLFIIIMRVFYKLITNVFMTIK